MFARPARVAPGDDGRLMCKLDGEALNGDLLDSQVEGVKAVLRKGDLVDGRKGKAMRINGADSRIIIENLESIEDALSLCYWIRLDGNEDRGMMDNDGGSHPGGRLRRTGLQALYWRGSEVAGYNLALANGGDPNKWIHVAITWGNEVRLYVNGELKSSGVKTVPSRNAYVKDIVLFRDLVVSVDDVMLFNKELTGDEIRKLYE
jgi:hypothetical protein